MNKKLSPVSYGREPVGGHRVFLNNILTDLILSCIRTTVWGFLLGGSKRTFKKDLEVSSSLVWFKKHRLWNHVSLNLNLSSSVYKLHILELLILSEYSCPHM